MTDSILPNWFDSGVGCAVMEEQLVTLPQLIPDQYYQVGVQLGGGRWPVLDSLNVGVPIVLESQLDARGNGHLEVRDAVGSEAEGAEFKQPSQLASLIAEPEALPFAEHSVDLVIMPHGLDFCADPVNTLREVNQVLVPEGHLVLTGFNQTSLWGCCRLANQMWPKTRNNPPWNGRFYCVPEIQEWLSLLGLELVAGAMMFYQFPLQSEKWRARLNWMEPMGDRWWPGLGGVYLLVLKKKVYATSAKAKRYQFNRNWLGALNPVPAVNSVPSDSITNQSDKANKLARVIGESHTKKKTM